MTEVEIFWPAAFPSSPALEAETLLRNAGVQATCRIQPVRRGSETVLVLLTNAALEPFFGALFERLGGEVWAGLRNLVAHLLKQRRGQPAPTSVIFESTSSCAQFIFTTDMPVNAFRKAIELNPGPEPGRWTWDVKNGSWLRFETR